MSPISVAITNARFRNCFHISFPFVFVGCVPGAPPFLTCHSPPPTKLDRDAGSQSDENRYHPHKTDSRPLSLSRFFALTFFLCCRP